MKANSTKKLFVDNARQKTSKRLAFCLSCKWIVENKSYTKWVKIARAFFDQQKVLYRVGQNEWVCVFSILFKNRQKRLIIFCKHLTRKQCGISKIQQLIFNKFHLGPSLRQKLRKQSSSGKFCERKLTRKKRWFFVEFHIRENQGGIMENWLPDFGNPAALPR